MIQQGQMDIFIRNYDDQSGMVMARYSGSAFFGHSTAVDLLASLKKGLGKLELKKILQISMDGPNGNWKLVELLEEELEDNEESLISIGSCGLHVVNRAFQGGHQTTSWNVNSLLKAMYTLFKDSPARRADHIQFSGDEKFALKFCAVRWTENSKVADRAIEVYSDMTKFVKEKLKSLKHFSSANRVAEADSDPPHHGKAGIFFFSVPLIGRFSEVIPNSSSNASSFMG